ncbi:uncharacterized protein NESG_02463 [Nematocida ausubeli]|uniref:Uncharacterized protein n=1 Tax=Nematocida ausubeli (strain ATCC PRA-371 / ERTm2) TaxID=1913371 RepID=A0A086IYX6_NEMA1|nr:uncharacterized protein NESG_02463 [Nematocida ausubeli]KFG25094.1 hypothetical protein NESG_02463 [Nematocida ausubeli]
MNKSNTSERRNQLHKYLYKRKNRQIPISLLAKVLLICMLLSMQNVLGLLSEEDMNTVIRVLLSGTKGKVSIKIGGNISPIILYAYGKVDILYNNRFTDLYIKKYYFTSPNKGLFWIRDSTNDIAREEDSEGNRLPNRVVDHYNALINMFPSPYEKISIYPKEGCKDSFTSFLKSDPVKEYAHNILAILFLRAEGVPVPLIIEDEESACPRLTWTDEFNPEQSFSVPICIASAEEQESSDSNEEANIKKSSSKIVQTIKYFLNAESCQELEESIALKESAEKEVYWKNEFTKTPTWLIQSYIYYYLETIDDIDKLYYNIIKKLVFCKNKYPLGSNYRNIAQKIRNKLFALYTPNPKALKWWRKIKEFEGMAEASKKIRLLPFADNSLLPTKITVGANTQGSVQPEEWLISSDIESVLLTLLCCIAYDPKTDKYNFDHLPYMSKEVKSLFAMPSKNASTSSDSSETSGNPDINNPPSSNTPVIQVGQKIPQEVQKKWSKIIKNLVKRNTYISYTTLENNKRVIEPDILNILIIMIKVTGLDCSKYIEQIHEYRERLQDREQMDGSFGITCFTKGIAEYAEVIFFHMTREFLKNKTLADVFSISSTSSNDKRIMLVNFVDYSIQIVNNKNYLTGSIVIHYVTKCRNQSIVIRFVTPEKVHLGIRKCAVNSGCSKLQIEIPKIPIDSYILHVLSEYVKTINPPEPSDITRKFQALQMPRMLPRTP